MKGQKKKNLKSTYMQVHIEAFLYNRYMCKRKPPSGTWVVSDGYLPVDRKHSRLSTWIRSTIQFTAISMPMKIQLSN